MDDSDGKEGSTAMREFSAALLEPFDLRLRRVNRAYGAFICDTNKGVMLVKTTLASEGAIWFAHGAKEHLALQGFTGTDRYQLSREGRPWDVLPTGEYYTVRRWLRAEEAQPEEQSHAIRMAGILGRLHAASHHYEASDEAGTVNRCYEWPERIYKSHRKLQSYGKMLRKNGRYTEFDLMVLEALPRQTEAVGEAGSYFMDKAYTEFAGECDKRRTFGHNSYTDHAVLLNAGHSLVAGFEEACYMIPTFDLVNLLEKALRKNDWSVELCYNMLEAYHANYPLGEQEKRLLYAGMVYPGRFLSLCEEAYHTKRSWIPISYKRKLDEFMSGQEKRGELLKKLWKMLQ